MRQDRGIYLLEKFRINNGVFQGIIVTREKGYTIEDVSLNSENAKLPESVIYQFNNLSSPPSS